MTKEKLEIHSENILPIIKKWLYSDKDIFIRELVSNSCDAIKKLKLLKVGKEEEFRIDLKIDKEAKTLTFTDTGIGMDEEEVKKYIAQIAFSGAEDFIHKYQEGEEKDQFIGHFGLGFYSAYMVADLVDIDTLSYKPEAKPVFWSCDGSSDYEIREGTRTTRGTKITLHIGKDHEEYLEEHKIQKILKEYCSFLPYPVYLGETRINTLEPLWIQPPSECEEKDYIGFYRHLYPMDDDPLFWVHLNVDYPFHLKGILYFPKLKKNFDLEKSTVHLYCNRVFVSDNCKDVIPKYLAILKGVIDSPDIPLNVSRSYLQMDKTVRQLGNHISKKVSDSLSNLYKNDKDKFLKIWEDISFIVKLGALEDEKFYERVKDLLLFKTTTDEWMTTEEYLEKNKNDKILYTKDASHNKALLDVYEKKGIDVLLANHPIDQYLIQFLEGKIVPKKFQRIDGAIDDQILDPSKEKIILDEEGKTEGARLASFVHQKLNLEGCEVVAKSLATDNISGFVMIDEEQRRMRDYFLQFDPKTSLPLVGKHTFVINTNHSLVNAAMKLDKKHPELATEIVKEIYELALLSQREIEPQVLNDFVLRTNKVIETLANQVIENG